MTQQKSPSNDLVKFMSSATKMMADEYERIQERAQEDPGTAGDQGEENWATLLRSWLPHTFHIVTKGRILSHKGIASPQVDVIVLQPEYPTQLLDKKLYLAGGVLAAFECKITLKANHIDEFVKNSIEIRNQIQERKGTPYKELQSPILYGLLAHSHSWKGENSTPIENIESKLWEVDEAFITHPFQIPDILCVADLATWTSTKMAFIGPRQVPNWGNGLNKIYGENGSATSGYIRHSKEIENQTENFSPIGAMITALFQKLAWQVPGLQNLSSYFTQVNIQGSGQGNMRTWESSIYSEEVKNKVEKGFLSNGNIGDEWSVTFI